MLVDDTPRPDCFGGFGTETSFNLAGAGLGVRLLFGCIGAGVGRGGGVDLGASTIPDFGELDVIFPKEEKFRLPERRPDFIPVRETARFSKPAQKWFIVISSYRHQCISFAPRERTPSQDQDTLY